MRGVRRGVVMVVLLAVGLLSTAVSGASAAGWLAPVDVPLSVSDVGFDADGNAIAVGVGADAGGDAVFRSMARPAGGAWSALAPVSGSGDSDVSSPHVAVNAQGDAVAIWSAHNQDAAKRVVRVSSRPAGGAWSNPIKLSDGGVVNRDQEIAIDAQGNATAIWAELGDDGFVVRSARRLSGNWDEPVELSEGAVGSSPRLAVDAQGNVTAVWLGYVPYISSPGVVSVVRSNWRSASGDWNPTSVALSAEDNISSAQGPELAIDAQGNATAVWELFDSTNGYRVQAARRAVGASWGSPATLSAGNTPQVAVTPQGNATAVWQTSGPSATGVHRSDSLAGGAWSAPVDLATGAGIGSDTGYKVGYPWVAADPQGNVTAIWARYNDSDVIAQATHRVAGSWSPIANLTVGRPITAIPAAGLDPQGHTTMIWSSSEDPWEGSSAVFDPVGPELRNVTVPPFATVGQPVAMSADPFDTWSAVTTTWDFGDGQSAGGAAVTHAYAASGEYTVTISDMDAAGNTTKSSQKITVGRVIVDPRPEDPKTPGPDRVPPPALRAPVLSALQQTNARWRTHSVRRGPKLPVGTAFRFKLDRTAQVRLAFSQLVTGRRVGGRCVKATKANRRKPRCDRSLAVGTLSVAGKAGSNSVTFRGTLRGRTLPPGRYRVVVTASADGKTSSARSLQFTIVR